MERYQLIELVDGLEKVYRTSSPIAEALGEIKQILKNTSTCGPTREQAGQMRGEWVNWGDGVCCSICGAERPTKSGTIKFSSRLMRFCPYCGAPMTDEAVDIVMERLEKLYEDR